MDFCSLLRKSFPASVEMPSNYYFRLHFRGLLGEKARLHRSFANGSYQVK